ncbi:MAG: hypothetical protein Q3W78_01005, partial [Collinsella sp.]|nr:hypothetical protein [Collinsella sp.]
TPANFAAAVGPMPSSVARRKSSTFSLLYMRTSSPDRPAVQLSVRTPFSQLRTLPGSIPVARHAYENGSGTK